MNTQAELNKEEEMWISIDNGIDNLFNKMEEPLSDEFVITFGSAYQLQISKVSGVYKVTNGVNGYGNNCLSEFIDAEVKILSEWQSKQLSPVSYGVEAMKKKYETYVSNVIWHIRTNNPIGEELQKCNRQVEYYNEVITDLNRLDESPIPVSEGE